jgi:hypothetical protein
MKPEDMDQIPTVPSNLDEFPPSVVARDAQLVRFIRASHELAMVRLTGVESRAEKLALGLSENTRVTNSIAKNLDQVVDDTKDLVEVAKASKGAIKVLNWVGALAKPIWYIAVCVTALVGLWAALKGFVFPSDITPPK